MKAIVTECIKWDKGYLLEITLYDGSTGVVKHTDNKTPYSVGSHIEVKLIEKSDTNYYIIV